MRYIKKEKDNTNIVKCILTEIAVLILSEILYRVICGCVGK